jgi:ribose 5-phosphate isomerase A
MTDKSAQKQRAVEAAIEHLPHEGVIGLGSGSTAELFIKCVAKLLHAGRKFRGIATSLRSEQLATELGIPLLDGSGPWKIDVCVDGADEVSDSLDLIKGGGACHLREKIVNASSQVNIIVVDESKLSHKLGERWAVPVEVATFGHLATAQHLATLGAVTPRRLDRNDPQSPQLVTDSGNYIYDVRTGTIDDPAGLDAMMHQIPGVVETGLFVSRTTMVVVAGDHDVRVITR